MQTAAFGCYLAFIVSWFLHLTARVPVLGQIRLDLLIVALTGVLTLLGSHENHHPGGGARKRGRLLLILAAYPLVTLPFVEWPGSVLKYGLEAFLKALVFYFFSISLVRTERRLKVFMLVFLACQIVRVVEPLYLHQTEGYWGASAYQGEGERLDRLSGAPSDTINPNGLAYVILTALTFLHYLGPGTVLGTLGYCAFLPLALYALVLTGSRTGIVCLGVACAVIWLKSRRKVLMAAAAACVVIATVPVLPPDTLDRYKSVFDSNTKNAATAQGRWTGVLADWRIAMRRPIFGHGLGTSTEANYNFAHSGLRSHNLYTETAQEIGLVGLAIFGAWLVSTAQGLRAAGRCAKAAPRGALVARVTSALQVWFVMSLALSFVSYGLSGYQWYLLAALSEQMTRLASKRADTVVRGAAPGEPAV